MEGRHKSISYYFTQFDKKDGPCKLDFLKISDSNQSQMKIKKNNNKLNKSEQKAKIEQKRPSSSHIKQPSKTRICEKMKENSFNAYIQNSRNIKTKSKDFNTNASVNISYSRPINTTTEDVSHRTLGKIQVILFYTDS
jgi:hypothetical protein